MDRRTPLEVDSIDYRLRVMELRNAEIFGAEGDGGRFGAMEEEMRKHSVQLDDLMTFKTKALLIVAVATPLGGLAAAFAFKLIDHFLK